MKLLPQRKLCFLTSALVLASAAAGSQAFAAWVEHGTASWYSVRTNGGTQTASGQTLHDGAATAAHKSLPLGSKVRVTNLNNGRSQVVTINDRGPYIAGRIIDLTVGMAERLGFFGAGLAPVKVETVGGSSGASRENSAGNGSEREQTASSGERERSARNSSPRGERRSGRESTRRSSLGGIFTGPRRF